MDYSIQRNEPIVLREDGKIKQVFIADIVYIESKGYQSLVHLVDCEKNVIVCKILREFETELTKYGFVRINRNRLLNMKYFKEYNYKTLRVVLNDDTECIVSRRKLSAIKQFLFK